MIKKARHAGTNYKMIRPFVEKVNEVGSVRFKKDGYMDLTVEYLEYSDYAGKPVYSICHYGIENGDLMRDPEITFSVDQATGTVTPLTFQNDYGGLYDEVFIEKNGKTLYSPSRLKGVDDFMNMWLKNIINQGFDPERFEKII